MQLPTLALSALIALTAACTGAPDEAPSAGAAPTGVPSTDSAPAFPSVLESGDEVSVHLSADTHLRYALEPFRLRSVVLAGRALDVAPSNSSRFTTTGKRPEPATATSPTAVGDAVEFAVHVTPREQDGTPNPAAGRRLTETLSAPAVADASGYRRVVHQDPRFDPHRGEREWPPSVWFTRNRLMRGERWRKHVTGYYGYSTVSDPGVTYDVLSLDLEDGARLWLFWSYHHFMNQANNPGIDPRLEEVVLLAGPGASLSLGDVLAALVEQPHDRRTLLKAHAPARFEAEYGASEER